MPNSINSSSYSTANLLTTATTDDKHASNEPMEFCQWSVSQCEVEPMIVDSPQPYSDCVQGNGWGVDSGVLNERFKEVINILKENRVEYSELNVIKDNLNKIYELQAQGAKVSEEQKKIIDCVEKEVDTLKLSIKKSIQQPGKDVSIASSETSLMHSQAPGATAIGFFEVANPLAKSPASNQIKESQKERTSHLCDILESVSLSNSNDQPRDSSKCTEGRSSSPKLGVKDKKWYEELAEELDKELAEKLSEEWNKEWNKEFYNELYTKLDEKLEKEWFEMGSGFDKKRI